MENLITLERKFGDIKPNYVSRGYDSGGLFICSYEEIPVFKQVSKHELKFTIKYDDSNLEIEYLPDISHYALPAEVPSLLMLSFIDAVHEVAQNFCQQRRKCILHHHLSFPMFQAWTRPL